MNKLFDNNISLDRDNHIYQLKTNPKLNFTSVTTFISNFFEPFDAEKIAEILTKSKNPKFYIYTKQELMDKWKKASDDGTIIHEELEKFIKSRTQPKEYKAKKGIRWLEEYLSNENIEFSKDNIFSEVIIYSEKLKISGTIDVLIKNKEDEYIILDWKTSETIHNKGGKRGIKKATQDKTYSKKNIYELQLSLYRYILEKYYGITVNAQYLIHLQEERAEKIDTLYYKDKIKEMLETITGKKK